MPKKTDREEWRETIPIGNYTEKQTYGFERFATDICGKSMP